MLTVCVPCQESDSLADNVSYTSLIMAYAYSQPPQTKKIHEALQRMKENGRARVFLLSRAHRQSTPDGERRANAEALRRSELSDGQASVPPEPVFLAKKIKLDRPTLQYYDATTNESKMTAPHSTARLTNQS